MNGQNLLNIQVYFSPITLPPLQQRKEDIPLMVQAFIERYSRKLGKQITSIQKETAILGLYPSTLRSRMRKLGIVRPETKETD